MALAITNGTENIDKKTWSFFPDLSRFTAECRWLNGHFHGVDRAKRVDYHLALDALSRVDHNRDAAPVQLLHELLRLQIRRAQPAAKTGVAEIWIMKINYDPAIFATRNVPVIDLWYHPTADSWRPAYLSSSMKRAW
ncbi:hypothetical protein WR25_21089 [Diploscapter pachys]|uniref:Uncharacterized protein n=1 Tax=Diploscapter pachys TaxID=2018661 RepID=A0A2A2KF75_9BILA|nr:hypothetical protein WR25_21089 [Diploscapter pachys]